MDTKRIFIGILATASAFCGQAATWHVDSAGGNDAAAIHKSGAGVRTVAVSVPTRYIHSASCVAKLEDIDSVRKLAFRLAEDFANA